MQCRAILGRSVQFCAVASLTAAAVVAVVRGCDSLLSLFHHPNNERMSPFYATEAQHITQIYILYFLLFFFCIIVRTHFPMTSHYSVRYWSTPRHRSDTKGLSISLLLLFVQLAVECRIVLQLVVVNRCNNSTSYIQQLHVTARYLTRRDVAARFDNGDITCKLFAGCISS